MGRRVKGPARTAYRFRKKLDASHMLCAYVSQFDVVNALDLRPSFQDVVLVAALGVDGRAENQLAVRGYGVGQHARIVFWVDEVGLVDECQRDGESSAGLQVQRKAEK